MELSTIGTMKAYWNLESPDCIRERKVSELKASSDNYRNWREALSIRDAVAKKGGLGTNQYRDAVELIKFFHNKWEDELSNLECDLGDDEIDVRLSDLKNVMKNHQ